MERCYRHPYAVTRAKNFGGPDWSDWYGWTPEAVKTAELSNLYLSANSDPKREAQRVWTPRVVSVSTAPPADLDDAFAVLSRMSAQ